MLNGDMAAAQSFTAVLLDRARELGLSGWIARGHCFQGVLLIMRRDFVAGLPLLRDALEEMREGGAAPGYPAFLALLARGLGLAGQVTEGLAVIDQALDLSERHEENWSLPEVLRNKGELLLLERSVSAVLRGRGLLPASARLGPSGRHALLRIAGRIQPWPLMARQGTRRRGARACRIGVSPLHRRIRDWRSADRKAGPRRVELTASPIIADYWRRDLAAERSPRPAMRKRRGL